MPSTRPPSRRARLLLSIPLVALVACFNIYVQFPTAELSNLAVDYTREAWGTAPEERPAPPNDSGTDSGTEKPPERSESGFLGRLLCPPVHAAEGGGVDVRADSAAIRAIKAQQKERLKKLKPHFEAGRVGIAANGDLAIRNEDGIDLKGKKEMRESVEAENKSRADLYKEVAIVNKLDPARVDEIRRIFAAAWISEAPAGYWVQVDGKWQQKPAPKK